MFHSENMGIFGLEGDLPGQIHIGIKGPPGPPGKPFTYDDFTPEQLQALTGQHGKDGRSIYVLNATLGEPEEETFYYRFERSLILTDGREPQVGDLIISKNGILGSIHTFVEDASADAVICPLVKLAGENGALTIDCVITSDIIPPLTGKNVAFSVLKGSLKNVWEKAKNGEKPHVIYLRVAVPEGDYQCNFAEAAYVSSYDWSGTNPQSVKIVFYADNEVWSLESKQTDITGNRITSYTVTNGVGKPGADGKNGYSIYYMRIEVEYPVDGFVDHSTSPVNLSNNGSGVKVGDLLISSNGVLCNVTSVSANSVGFNPVAKIVDDTDDIVTAVLNELPTWKGGSY